MWRGRRRNIARCHGSPKRHPLHENAVPDGAGSAPSSEMTGRPRCASLVASVGFGAVALPGRSARCVVPRHPQRVRDGGAVLRPPSRRRREAYISAQHPPPCEEARLPCPDEHPRRTCGAQEPSRQGPRPPVGLIQPIRGRDDFATLSRSGRRIRRSSLWCTWCPQPQTSATHVAFAIGRAYGPAVARNRLRRRLREIMRDLDRQAPLPTGLLLIGARPTAIELTFDQLTTTMRSMVAEIQP